MSPGFIGGHNWPPSNLEFFPTYKNHPKKQKNLQYLNHFRNSETSRLP